LDKAKEIEIELKLFASDVTYLAAGLAHYLFKESNVHRKGVI
jgi:hypothetical protein